MATNISGMWPMSSLHEWKWNQIVNKQLIIFFQKSKHCNFQTAGIFQTYNKQTASKMCIENPKIQIFAHWKSRKSMNAL